MSHKKILVVCSTLGIHEKKFIEVCEKSAPTLIMNLSDFKSRQNIVGEKYDLLVFINLSNLEDGLVNINANKKIGISLAFEINEKHDFDMIKKNINRLDHIIVDCDHIKNSLYEEYYYLGPITKIAYGCNFNKIHNKTKIKNSYNNQGILSIRSWKRLSQRISKEKKLKIKYKWYGSATKSYSISLLKAKLFYN